MVDDPDRPSRREDRNSLEQEETVFYGKVIGGLIGLMVAGPFGLVLGLAVMGFGALLTLQQMAPSPGGSPRAATTTRVQLALHA